MRRLESDVRSIEVRRTAARLPYSLRGWQLFVLGWAGSWVVACGASSDTMGQGGGNGESGSAAPGGSGGGSGTSSSGGNAGASNETGTSGGGGNAGSTTETGAGGNGGAAGSSDLDSGSSVGTGGDNSVDARQPDSAAGGALGGADAGAATCPTGAVFCDDFEASSALGAAWTTDNTLGATVKVVNSYTTSPGPTAAHSGKNAVQISFGTGVGYAMIVEKMGFPASTGYWGRVWLHIETPSTDTGHDVYLEGSTGANLANGGARPLNTSKGNMTINIDPVGTSEASASTTTPIPTGAWTCFEWQITATGGTGDIVLYVGGAQMPTATLKGKPIEALTEQRVGYERYAAGTAGNLWIDDYAIGSQRLGCK